MSDETPPEPDLVAYLRERILGTRWPNGDRLDGITTRTATMIAEHLAASPLILVPLSAEDRALITNSREAVREEVADTLTSWGIESADDWWDLNIEEFADRILALVTPLAARVAPDQSSGSSRVARVGGAS